MILDAMAEQVIRTYMDFLGELLSFELPSAEIDNKNSYVAIEFVHNGGQKGFLPMKHLSYLDFSETSNLLDCLISITIEVRQQYQYDCCYDVFYADCEAPELLRQWKRNYMNIIPKNEEGFSTQPLQVDIRCFVSHIIRILFGINVYEINKHLSVFAKRADDIAYEYITDEILECAQEVGLDDYISYILDDFRSSEMVAQ